uniref:Uncharacterized protein n=1 Tax=Cannabis sativa TaxID=3483 RepID=A0A803P9N0_CANSA
MEEGNKALRHMNESKTSRERSKIWEEQQRHTHLESLKETNPRTRHQPWLVPAATLDPPTPLEKPTPSQVILKSHLYVEMRFSLCQDGIGPPGGLKKTVGGEPSQRRTKNRLRVLHRRLRGCTI